MDSIDREFRELVEFRRALGIGGDLPPRPTPTRWDFVCASLALFWEDTLRPILAALVGILLALVLAAAIAAAARYGWEAGR